MRTLRFEKSFFMTPWEVCERLDRRIIGRERASRLVSIVACKGMKRLPYYEKRLAETDAG